MAEKGSAPRYRHDGFTPARKALFLEALGQCGCYADACRVAGVSRKTFYYHRDRWADFRGQCEAAIARATVPLETLAWQRAVEGTPEKIIRGGEVVQIRLKPSDSVLRLLLQASNPKKYGRLSRGGPTRREIESQLRKRVENEVRAAIAEQSRVDGAELFERLARRIEEMEREEMEEKANRERSAEDGR
jgi:hypothetical protein